MTNKTKKPVSAGDVMLEMDRSEGRKALALSHKALVDKLSAHPTVSVKKLAVPGDTHTLGQKAPKAKKNRDPSPKKR
jgi:hypothetical protein